MGHLGGLGIGDSFKNKYENLWNAINVWEKQASFFALLLFFRAHGPHGVCKFKALTGGRNLILAKRQRTDGSD